MTTGSDNLFTFLGIAGREDPVTEVFAAALAQFPAFRSGFLNALGLQDVELSTSTQRRYGSEIPDLVAWSSEGTDPLLIVLEHKLKAEEGDRQTERYSAEELVAQIVGEHSISDPGHVEFVYLHLFPDVEPASTAFRSLTHRQVLSEIDRDALEKQAVGLKGQALLDWLALAEDFYRAETIENGDDFLKRMRKVEPLEAGFLYFRRWLDLLREELHDFSVGSPWRYSVQGRPSWRCQIWKPEWRPQDRIETDADSVSVDPYRHVNIHLEPAFQILHERLDIPLHYELNPYRTKSWAKKRMTAADLDEFERVREDFKHHLSESLPRGWKITNYWLQVAKLQIPLEGIRTGQATDQVASAIRELGNAVDVAGREAGLLK